MRKGIWVRLLRRHFVFVNMAKNSAQFTWSDDEVELMLKVTNEYKVSCELRARFTGEISRQNSNLIQIDAVSPFTRQMKPYRFENDPVSVTVSTGVV